MSSIEILKVDCKHLNMCQQTWQSIWKNRCLKYDLHAEASWYRLPAAWYISSLPAVTQFQKLNDIFCDIPTHGIQIKQWFPIQLPWVTFISPFFCKKMTKLPLIFTNRQKFLPLSRYFMFFSKILYNKCATFCSLTPFCILYWDNWICITDKIYSHCILRYMKKIIQRPVT